jgi:coenzyme PQQ synthesis protein D (PqqD)
MGFPRARTENMIVEPLSSETLVCDPERNCAHSLRPLAAAIWPRCDGETSPAELAAAARDLGFEADEELVTLALPPRRRLGAEEPARRRVAAGPAAKRGGAGRRRHHHGPRGRRQR